VTVLGFDETRRGKGGHEVRTDTGVKDVNRTVRHQPGLSRAAPAGLFAQINGCSSKTVIEVPAIRLAAFQRLRHRLDGLDYRRTGRCRHGLRPVQWPPSRCCVGERPRRNILANASIVVGGKPPNRPQ
jgi:hypothetical protein